MNHPALDQLDAVATQIRVHEERRLDALAAATGLGVDHESAPSMLAVVKGNRLVGLEIHDSLLDEYRTRPHEFAVYVNSVISRAFDDWRADYNAKAVG
jgi:hypothetical protein